MMVPFKEISYVVWDIILNRPRLVTKDKDEASKLYNSHANKKVMELWKHVTTEDGTVERIKLS